MKFSDSIEKNSQRNLGVNFDLEKEFRFIHSTTPYNYYMGMLTQGSTKEEAFCQIQFMLDEIWNNYRTKLKLTLKDGCL